jgi:hypothetical protein
MDWFARHLIRFAPSFIWHVGQDYVLEIALGFGERPFMCRILREFGYDGLGCREVPSGIGLPPDAPEVRCERLRSSAVADLDMVACRAVGATVTMSARRARYLTTRTDFGTPVAPGGGRLFSGIPHPPSLDGPRRAFFV